MFGFFGKSKGPFTALIMPSRKQFTIKSEKSENLLKVALQNDLRWPHNCRVGSCGTCKCRLVSGEIKPLNDFSYVLTGDELDAGYILACQTMLKSDAVIEVELGDDVNGVQLPKSRNVKGRIAAVNPLTHDIVSLRVDLDEEFGDYLPGQYAEIRVPGVVNEARSYSFASVPSAERTNSVSFFIRRVPNGRMTEWLFAGDRVGEQILLEGPYGSFYLRKPDGPILLVAGGSGLAPIRALLQQIVEQRFACDVTVIFGARTRKDLYCLDEFSELGGRVNGKFRFLPVLSEEAGANGWDGLTGNCPDAITAHMLDARRSHAYLCGPPAMVDAARHRLETLGLGQDKVHFDKFLDASTMPGGRLTKSAAE